MKTEKAIILLNNLIEEIKGTQYDQRNGVIEKANMVVRKIFGSDSLNFKDFNNIQYGPVAVTFGDSHHTFTSNWEKYDKKTMISKLSAYTEELRLDLDDNTAEIAKKNYFPNQVFIVHGRDEELKEKIKNTLIKLDLEPIILHEQANKGRIILEKFEDHSNVGYAIVLLTPDDKGSLKNDSTLKERARQNVVFEFGFFIGKLGRDHVFILYKESESFEKPSDIDGLVYCNYDEKGAWKMRLVKEMKAIGYQIDANKLIS
ncbi:MAG: TIR domain-containing protein [Promethearchaeota archaeon]